MIKPCAAREFENKARQINSYLINRGVEGSESNYATLLRIIKLYFEVLLYHQKNSVGGHRVKIKGQLYQIEVPIPHEDGEDRYVSIDQCANNLIKCVFDDLKSILDNKLFNDYLPVSNEVLETKAINLQIRLFFFYCETKAFPYERRDLLFAIGEDKAINSIHTKRNLLYEILEEESNVSDEDSEKKQRLDVIYRTYKTVIWAAVRIFIFHNHFDKIFKFLHQEFEFFDTLPKEIQIDDDLIINFLLTEIISNNHLFVVETKEAIRERYEDYRHFLSKHNQERFEKHLKFDMTKVSISHLSHEMVEHDFNGTDNSEIVTIISFVVSGFELKKEGEVLINDRALLRTRRVDNLFDDPVFSHLDESRVTSLNCVKRFNLITLTHGQI